MNLIESLETGVEAGRGKSKNDMKTASIQKLIKEIKFK